MKRFDHNSCYIPQNLNLALSIAALPLLLTYTISNAKAAETPLMEQGIQLHRDAL
jgi:hypothetical protein